MAPPKRGAKAAGGLSLDLLEQLTFYGQYHSHPANKGEFFLVGEGG